MDDVIVRSRYPRHTIPGRRRKRNIKEKNSLPQLIFRQFVICLIILVLASVVRNINNPITNFISDKIQYTLKQNIELKTIYESMNNAVNQIKNSNLLKNNGLITDNKSSNNDGTNNSKTENKSTGNNNKDNIESDNKGTGDNTDNNINNNADSSSSPASSVLSANTEDSSILKPDFITPVEGILSSSFGERIDPTTKVKKNHEGIDIAAAKGTSILAALNGTVIDSGTSPTYGKYLKIKHDGGYETVYAHCSVLKASKEKKVKQGDVIASVGDTGASVGNHLHFEIWKDGKAVNPLDYVNVPLQ